jgi:hypothetical protein
VGASWGAGQNEPHEFKNLNQVVRTVSDRIKQNALPIQDSTGRIIIPLPYYFVENCDVADEKLSYEQIIDSERLPVGFYGVRFYIEGIPTLLFSRLHRVVHGSFEVPPTPEPTNAQAREKT